MSAVKNHPVETAPLSPATAALFEQAVIPNYRRYPVELVRGEGSFVWDAAGTKYLDFFPGWGCNVLGHCPPRVVEAVRDQVGKLIHVPNTWYTQAQGQWAKMLTERGFGGKAFFCNSGTEANEAAIKLARMHFSGKRFRIITFEGGFHGRTLGSTAATAQPKYHEGLGPLVAGFNYCPFGDLDAVREAITDETAAILVEPIQGEGGVRIPEHSFLAGLRAICDERGLLLMFDEVQAGFGRTGNWYAYQHFGVTPDVMTLAKGVCAGIAGGAMIVKDELAASLKPGMHAATFGGNPIAAAAGIAAIETIEEDDLLAHTSWLEGLFRERLTALAADCDVIRDVRAVGVMIGLELDRDGTAVVAGCLERGLLVNCTHGNVIRLLPAMNLDEKLLDQGCEILADVIESL